MKYIKYLTPRLQSIPHKFSLSFGGHPWIIVEWQIALNQAEISQPIQSRGAIKNLFQLSISSVCIFISLLHFWLTGAAQHGGP
jgi:hypothetical protein